MKVPFKRTYYDETETSFVSDALLCETDYISKVKEMLSAHLDAHIFLTNSASAAFELLFEALCLPKDSEVILPSFTYPSAANTLLRYGLTPVFADIDEAAKVLSIADVKSKITARTKCIIPTHYGGVSVDLRALKAVCADILIAEDAALSFDAAYQNRPLGSIGDYGIVSFHHTKNISADQGGLLIVNKENAHMITKLQTIYDNGTNKQAFLRKEVDAYTWQQRGCNCAMSNISAAVLFAQLKKAKQIRNLQREVCEYYEAQFASLEEVSIPNLPTYNQDNYHVFYIVLKDFVAREKVRKSLEENGIGAHFHYMPLHSSAIGKKLGYAPGDLPVTQDISKRLLRLPVYAGLSLEECEYVAACVKEALRR